MKRILGHAPLIFVRLTPREWNETAAVAGQLGISAEEVIQRAIAEYLRIHDLDADPKARGRIVTGISGRYP